MSIEPMVTDVCVIGAGVIGCAVARELRTHGLSVLVVDAYPKQGMGVTARNSEVIHAGLYYPTDSLKARFCVEGRELLYPFAKDNDIAHQKTGKILLATSPEEEEKLELIRQQAEQNGVEGLSYLSSAELAQKEPSVKARTALFCPESGIVSAHELCDCLQRFAQNDGAEFVFKTAVTSIVREAGCWKLTTDTVVGPSASNGTLGPSLELRAEPYAVQAATVINCAGLHSDWIASLAGIDIVEAKYQLHWVKGDYYALSPAWSKRFSHLIYPIPEARGLGVHVTLDVAGQARLGPDAIDIERIENYQVDESRGEVFFEAAKKYLPELTPDALSPSMSGIRPKASAANEPRRDFIIAEETERGLPGLINTIGIDSPGLTASLAIAKYVATLI